MYFQSIDQNRTCQSVFFDGKIITKPDYSLMRRSWSYHPSFADKGVELGYILTNGRSLDEVCPEHLKDKWEKVNISHKLFENAFKEAKIDLKEHCFYDLVPENFLIDFFGLKNEITKYVFENFNQNKNFKFLSNLNEVLEDISTKELNLELNFLNNFNEEKERIENLKFSLNSHTSNVKYNIFGTITGRLTTEKNSFPILTLDRKFRNIIKSTNDWLIEFDFNSAELRAFLGLNEKSQPEKDIHEWHKELNNKVFSEDISREEMKKKFFAWFYGGKEDNFGIKEIDEAYDRNKILNRYYHNNSVTTPYGRTIETDRRKAVNIVVQSTMADIFYERVIAVSKYLREESLETYISLLIHDNMVLDVKKEDIKHISKVLSIFSDTRYGKFPVTVKIGKNLGEMRVINMVNK